jgi:hypothetical protein
MKIAWKITPLLLLVGGMATLRADTPAPAVANQTDYTAQAAQIRQQIQTDARYVLYLQALAHKQKDVIKLNCVNDKLILIKGEQNVADSANDQLQSPGEDHSEPFARLQRAGESAHNLRQEAAACVGETELSKQESGGEFSHPEFVDDPTLIPFAEYVEPPAFASPFN